MTLFDSTDTNIFALMPLTAKHYPAAYETLLQGHAIKCASTGTEFTVVPSPAAVFIDVRSSLTLEWLTFMHWQILAMQQFHATRAQSGAAIPVFLILAAPAAATIRLFGPEMLGGLGDLSARIDAEVARTGRPEEEVGSQVCLRTFYCMRLELIPRIVYIPDLSTIRRPGRRDTWSPADV